MLERSSEIQSEAFGQGGWYCSNLPAALESRAQAGHQERRTSWWAESCASLTLLAHCSSWLTQKSCWDTDDTAIRPNTLSNVSQSMLSPPVSAKSVWISVKPLPQTTAVTTGSAIELVLTGSAGTKLGVFNYFFINCFHMLVCSLCHFFHWLLVFDSIWTAKRSFSSLFCEISGLRRAAERCCSLWVSRQPNAAEPLAPPSQPGIVCLCVCVCVWFGFFSF